MRLRPDPYRQHVGAYLRCEVDIERPAGECAADVAERTAVEPNLRMIVDAVEGEVDGTILPCRRRVKLHSVPPALPREVGNQQIIEPVQWVRIYPLLYQRGEHGAGHRGIVPPASVETRLGDGAGIGIDRGGVG